MNDDEIKKLSGATKDPTELALCRFILSQTLEPKDQGLLEAHAITLYPTDYSARDRARSCLAWLRAQATKAAP